MTNTFSRFALALFALLTMAASVNVALVQAQAAAPGEAFLVYTPCRMGVVNQCGEDAAHTECTRSWKLDLGWLTQQFGIGISEVKCEQVGKVTLYKDMWQRTNGGACGINPQLPFNPATPVGDGEEPLTDEAGTC